MRFLFSPDVTLSGCLGSKHKLTDCCGTHRSYHWLGSCEFSASSLVGAEGIEGCVGKEGRERESL